MTWIIHRSKLTRCLGYAITAIFGASSTWAFTPGDEYTNQPALATIKVIDAYNQGYSGLGIKIGVVDTGINPNHVEFINAIAAGYNNGRSGTSNFSSFLYDTGYGSDTGHGTFVSSVAAARLDNAVREGNIQGVAYNAKLVIGELGEYKKLTDQRFADTIDYVSAQPGVRVINNSWGVDSNWGVSLIADDNNYATDSPQTIAALKRAQDRGAVIVFAAGNDSVGWPGAPGTLPSIDPTVARKGGWITVAATTIRGINPDTGEIEMAQTRPALSPPKQAEDYYTNYCGDAKLYCISAPGGLVVPKSETPWGDTGMAGALSSSNDKYDHGNGTSYAAPVVSGAVALVAEKYPWMTNKNLATTILTTGTTAANPSDVWGRGLLDVGKAINGPGIFEEVFDANVTSAYSSTFSNNISGDAGLNKLGAGTLTLSGANTYSGATTVNDGTLSLSGSNGAIASSSGVTISGGSILKLDNTAAANNTSRLKDTGTVTMNGGTLNLANDSGAANFSETTGALTHV